MMPSVLTLVRGRSRHLSNLIEGLNRQTRQPCELVIAYMQDAPVSDLPATRCPVRTVMVPGEPMPLAAARNRAAEVASGDLLLFLDVDCIPSATLVDRYTRVAGERDGVLLGEVRYLPEGATDGPFDESRLAARGQRHPAKPMLMDEDVLPIADHGELWGLSFAIRRQNWMNVGGMDERYVGYGAEETDFAARLKAADVPMWWVGGAVAYHQHHAVHIPPLQHFAHIVRNARLYHERWGRWCMDYWLGQLRDGGFVEWDDDRLTVIREPTADEIAATRAPGTVLFS